LNNLKFGLASTNEPYVDDENVLRIYQKLIKGLSFNINLNSLGLYLLSWGEIEKSFFSMQELLKEKSAFLDVYFFGFYLILLINLRF